MRPVPAELRWLAWAVEPHWPEADEDALRRCARAWRDAAGGLRAALPDADRAGTRAAAALQGPTAEAVRAAWDRFTVGDDGQVEVLAVACADLAAVCDATADVVEAARHRLTGALAQLARELLLLAALTPVTAGLSAAGAVVAAEATRCRARDIGTQATAAIADLIAASPAGHRVGTVPAAPRVVPPEHADLDPGRRGPDPALHAPAGGPDPGTPPAGPVPAPAVLAGSPPAHRPADRPAPAGLVAAPLASAVPSASVVPAAPIPAVPAAPIPAAPVVPPLPPEPAPPTPVEPVAGPTPVPPGATEPAAPAPLRPAPPADPLAVLAPDRSEHPVDGVPALIFGPPPGNPAGPAPRPARPPGDEALVAAVLDRAAEAEERLTPVLEEIAEAAGGELLGREHRLKTPASVRRKVAEELAESPPSTLPDVLGRFRDAVRYTVGLPFETYAEGAAAVRGALAGYELVRWHNSWGDGYPGLVGFWRDGDVLFEVRVHTRESFAAWTGEPVEVPVPDGAADL